MNKNKFSLAEQLRYSWVNVLLAFVVLLTVILVADVARGDRAIVECRGALMQDLHENLGDNINPDGTLENWDILFEEWHHRVASYQTGQSVPGFPECQR